MKSSMNGKKQEEKTEREMRNEKCELKWIHSKNRTGVLLNNIWITFFREEWTLWIENDSFIHETSTLEWREMKKWEEDCEEKWNEKKSIKILNQMRRRSDNWKNIDWVNQMMRSSNVPRFSSRRVSFCFRSPYIRSMIFFPIARISSHLHSRFPTRIRYSPLIPLPSSISPVISYSSTHSNMSFRMW